ncbi:SpoIIE family protein phosphatase [Fusibacter paucivorans]|uniref:Stage 0 sporulation protein A homolog n=1 Tax=Fusibacter paucivorans TaxID=76009 RepID=A0ABS5PMP7_9FIRM|nr:SpoIIE family protein phosphatase [Fusibacter paucivorans]MBS7526316.1 SpoIIE family protein phosphatase [Fusibacter paucivorans]
MGYCILIADDANMNRMLVKEILSQSLQNVTFEEAANGLEVLEIVSKKQIDLIMLDLIMPKMDGYETLKKLKSHERSRDIPVIVNSSIREIASIESTLKSGAVDYFTKPLSPDDMNIILPLKAKNALIMYEQSRTIFELNREIQEELKNANVFANIMLPKSDSFEDIDLYIKYQPSLGIGGDFFDCVERDGRVYFMIADVTGHGIAAGMASSMVKILFRKCVDHTAYMPHEILEDMNRAIFEYFDFAGRDHYFVFTAFVGIIDHGKLYYANAGQPYPLIYISSEDVIQTIEQNGFIVGIFDDIAFETEVIPFESDDSIFLYTDGLFCSGEASDITAWTEVKKVAEKFQTMWTQSPKDFLDEVLYAFHMIHKSKETHFNDDVAMMVLKGK